MHVRRSGDVGVIEKLILILLGASLNHSAVIGGINLSAADVILPLVLLILAAHGSLRIPPVALLLFSTFTAFLLINSVAITPALVPFSVDQAAVLTNYAKLVVCFLYFLVAYNLTISGRLRIVFRSFAAVALIAGALAVASTIIPALPLPEALYYGADRYRGFMNDPNYFSVVQLAAMAIILGDKGLRGRIRIPSLFILAASALLSGSKTGFLSLLALAAWWFLAWTFKKNRHGQLSPVRASFGVFSGVLVIFAFVLIFDEQYRRSIAGAIEPIPAINRLAPLLLDFNAGIQSGGSGRGSAWENAVNVIGVSPMSGVGIGTYLDVSSQVSGERVLAHNSLLQLSAEWGIPLTIAFFGFVLFLITRADSKVFEFAVSAKDTAIVFLVGSLGISLNNSRLFWVVIGVLFAGYMLSRRPPESPDAVRIPDTGAPAIVGVKDAGKMRVR